MAHDRIHTDPQIMFGKPVIRGTRIPVRKILSEFAVGETEASILEAYPSLTAEDVRAALSYAADALEQKRPVAAE